uniref:Hypothetical secreted peptide 1630 n=1 Tax=Amblyomma variegatum TaxID=34610 RepID=F0J9X4_AMBVA|nr:TPA_inf: hypothetical secreted peptide precursor 1630 [Amblyomma variegatum]
MLAQERALFCGIASTVFVLSKLHFIRILCCLPLCNGVLYDWQQSWCPRSTVKKSLRFLQ